MTITTKSILLLSVLLMSADAFAVCRMQNVCDDEGYCSFEQICDSTIDLPSVELPKIAPMQLPGIKPLERVALPPLGTSGCRVMLVDGQWQNVCH